MTSHLSSPNYSDLRLHLALQRVVLSQSLVQLLQRIFNIGRVQLIGLSLDPFALAPQLTEQTIS